MVGQSPHGPPEAVVVVVVVVANAFMFMIP
jgi:hypothetical protein